MTQSTVDETATLETLRAAVDQATVAKVFGAPIVQDDLTIVPVAKIGGGGGGGTGTGPAGDDAGGTGGGFGVSARPLGVFVIQGGRVSWRPALDLTKVILGGQLVAAATLLVIRAIIKARTGRTCPPA